MGSKNKGWQFINHNICNSEEIKSPVPIEASVPLGTDGRIH